MGIPQLFTFVTKRIPHCFYHIDIIKEINDWSRQNNIAEPTIVIDFPAFVHAICHDPLESFYGCRTVHCFKKAEQFFNVFKLMNVKLVFFEDGPMQLDKTEKLIQSHNGRITDIFKILDHLYVCNSVNDLLKKYNIRHHGCLKAGIRNIAQQFGEFHKSFHNECDKEAAAYATKVNAMAIISNDTDYLIFEGKWNYWSSSHINFRYLTTKCYNKINFQRYLMLNEEEMPLFATLAGNDIIPPKVVGYFRNHILKENTFPMISQYIRDQFRKRNRCDAEFITAKIFGKTNTIELPEFTDLVRKSLNSYNIHKLNVHDNDQQNFMHRIRYVENNCYAYLLDLARFCSIAYFDVRKPQYEKYPSLALDLIRRQLGIILQHKYDETLTRQIYGYQNGEYVHLTLYPVYPTITVPNLEDLYDTDKNDNLKMIKIQLLVWSLSARLDINSIITIEKTYFCVCLSLFYMVENGLLTVREADIFLHMVETVHEKFSTIKKELIPLKSVNLRAFQIVLLYDKTYQLVMDAISNCGLFDLLEQNHMDGLYFHYAYNKMYDLPENEQINTHLGQLRLYERL